MSARLPLTANVAPELRDRMFPVLSPAQIERIAARGKRRRVEPGEVLIRPGERSPHFFVVAQGEVEIVAADGSEGLIVALGTGMFTGEVSLLSGRSAMVRIQARETVEVIEVDHDRLMALLQGDAELGELLLRAFILRRTELVAKRVSDVVLVGSNHSPGTLRVKEFLTRNNQPYGFVDLDRDADVQGLLDRFQISPDEIPVLICRGTTVLRRPTNERIAGCLGLNAEIDPARVRDVVIVGGGPAGLAAAVYGASEGLDVLILESNSPGGQAASSSKIENYLGFPTGISGQDLASRAYTQAIKFGAQIVVARSAKRLACDRRPFALELDDGSRLPARSIVIATGADYRRLAVENLAEFEGNGVYYGATFVESQLCSGEDVIVVGGGNSAGQAATFLAEGARRVFMLIRGDGLEATMSRYLVRRIEENSRIELHTGTEIDAMEGNGRLSRVRWRDKRAGTSEWRDIRHVFVMTGAVPSTGWLQGCIALDDNGFVKTGPDLSKDDLAAAHWPLPRAPHLLETSLPGVFAVGDVRAGNVKRVASAVGEGSIAISFVHRILAE